MFRSASIWPATGLDDTQLLLLCVRGLADRLALLGETSYRPSVDGAILLSKNMTDSFVGLCLTIGAKGVLSRRESPRQLARMIRAVCWSDTVHAV